MRIALPFVVVWSIVHVQISHADLRAYEPFDYSSGGLLGKDGGVGFGEDWFDYGGAPLVDEWEIRQGSLSYPGLQTSGNHIFSETHFDDNWVGLVREFDESVDVPATRYMSFLVRPEPNLGDGSFGGAFGVVLSGLDGTGDMLVGMTEGRGNYMIEEFFNTGTAYSDEQVVVGETTFIVVKAELSQGRDIFTMYVNPPLGQLEPTAGTVKRLDIGDPLGIGVAAAGSVSLDELRWGDTFADVAPADLMLGDFDASGQLDVADIDLLTSEVMAGTNGLGFDLNGDRVVDHDDRVVWVESLKNSWFGDSNLDGEFSSADFVEVFQRGEYEDQLAVNSTWQDGDWDGDGEFSTSDFVIAFQGGGFETGPRTATQAVPEFVGNQLFAFLLALLTLIGQRQVRC